MKVQNQPAVNPGSPTYPLDVVAAFSEDRKSLSIAVLNPSDSEQSIQLKINGTKLASAGKLWRMAPDKIDASALRLRSISDVRLTRYGVEVSPARL